MEKIEQEATTAAVAQSKKVTDYSLGIWGTSDNWLMAGQMAKALSTSTLVPKEYQGNVSNCFIALDLAQRLSTSPFLVMQNLDIIQGRPSWSAKALIGMVNASGKYDFELQFEEKSDKDGKPFSCQCWTEKNGRKVTGPVIDMDMARAEGWTGKSGSKWKTMPQVMLRYRAASFFSRMNCPEVSMGFYTSEEVKDGNFIDSTATYVEAAREKAVKEIAENANSIPFAIPEPEPKPEPAQVVNETATAAEEENDPGIPFMA